MDRLEQAFQRITREINGITECYNGELTPVAQAYVMSLEKARQIIRQVADEENAPPDESR